MDYLSVNLRVPEFLSLQDVRATFRVLESYPPALRGPPDNQHDDVVV